MQRVPTRPRRRTATIRCTGLPAYRLTGITDAGTALESYTYNQTGDRLSKTATDLVTGAGSYAYTPGTHQLASIGSAPRANDADGNTTGSVIGGNTYGFAYNGRNRLTLAQLNGVTAGTYTYNALGERIGKVATTPQAVTERYAYNEAGQLIGEYGTTNRDYLWLGNLPVAVIDNTINGSVSTSAVNYVTADQLNTPRVVTDSAGTVIWQLPYQGNPWGEQQPTSSTGYVLNLRAPGQYYDAESGLVHNDHRDYCSACGRYIQSDPMGLPAAISTYAYVGNNPLQHTDRLGLQEDDVSEESPYEREALKQTFNPDFVPAESQMNRELREGECRAPWATPRGGTYALIDPVTQEIMRVGRSNDLARRRQEHARNALLGNLSFTPVDRTDDYAEQRGLEQLLHDQYDPPLDKVNPISPKNPNYNTYMNAANNYSNKQE